MTSLVIGVDSTYVIRGFELNMTGAIGSAASGLQLLVSNSSLLHGTSDESGTFFNIPSGASPEILNSTTNDRVEGSFAPNTENYIGIEFDRSPDENTTSQVYFWNPTNNIEFTRTVPLAKTLNLKIVITTSSFPPNVVPIAIVTTDSANNVISVEDRRPMLFRLGTAGSATPNPFHNYPWDNHTEGREENFYISSSSLVSPFRGGDKQLLDMKEFFDAVMTSIKEIKGTTYWYGESVGGSLAGLRYDLANTLMTGRGTISHDAGVAGKINWVEHIFLTVVSTRLKYEIEENPTSSDVILSDGQVGYLTLIRDVDVVPNLIFTQGSAIVESVGAAAWTSDLEAGDYVKVAAEGDDKYYKILTVDSISQVTLTENFQEDSTGIGGTNAKIAFGVYRTDPSPADPRHLKIDNIENVPFDEDVFWLFFREDDDSPVPKVYVRFLAAELQQGEERQISDNSTQNILTYIGSPSETAELPNYSSNIRGSSGEDLTTRSGVLTDAIGDSQEDRSAYLKSEENISWTGEQVEFDSNIDLEIINTKDGTTTVHTIETASSPIELDNGESAWVSIDRTEVSEIITVNRSGITPIPAQTQANKDVFVLFKRVDNGETSAAELYLPFTKQFVREGQVFRLGAAGGEGLNIKADYLDPVSTTLPTGTTVTIDGESGVDGDTVLFTNLDTGNNKIYELSGVGTSIQWEPVSAFADGSEDPENGDEVRILGGDAFTQQKAVFNGTEWLVNDTIRFFDGVSANFWEISSIKTSTLLNNTINSVFEVTAVGSENITVEYSIVRGVDKQTGHLIISHDGTDAAVARYVANVSDDIEIDFTADIDGGDLRLRYDSEDLGSDATMKYFVKRWSDAPGGPTGIPSYSPSTASTVSAAGTVGDIQFHGSAGTLDADPQLKWDSSNNAIDLNGLKFHTLSSPITIENDQSSPAILFSYSVSNKYSVIEYSIERDGNLRLGRLMIATNGTVIAPNDDWTEVGDTGVTIDAVISGSNVQVRYTSTDTGETGVFKYSIRRWT